MILQKKMNGKRVDFNEFVIQILKNFGVNEITETQEEIFARCPFHWPKKNFKCFSISTTKEDKSYPYHCFSCKSDGNIYTLISHIYKCDYHKAVKIFAKKVGVKPINLEMITKHMNSLRSSRMEKNEVKVVMPDRAEKTKLIEYFEERNSLQAHGVLDIDYIISKYDLYYCDSGQFANRIIMPIRDIDGRYIYFQNRAVFDYLAKNKFLKGTDATNYLYGIYETNKKNKVVLVEGPFDLYQLVSYSIRNKIDTYDFVCTMGTNITEYRASLISEFYDEAYILFDNDNAGITGTEIGYKVLNDYMKTYKWTQNLFLGKDPGNSSESQLRKVFAAYKNYRVMVSAGWPLI